MARDYYEILGVGRDARRHPARLSQAGPPYHPDVNKSPGAEDRFKEINEAYHVLSDPETAPRYDRLGPNSPDPRGLRGDCAGGLGPGWPGLPRVRGAHQWLAGRRRVVVPRQEDIDLEELLGGMFGGRGTGGACAAPTRRPSWSSPWRRPTAAEVAR